MINQIKIDEDDMCPICLTVLYKPTSLKTCNHIFCGPCIDQATHMYEHKKCPLCRKPFTEPDKTFLQQKNKRIEQLYTDQLKQKIANIKQTKYYRLQIGNTTEVINTEANNKYRWTLYVQPAPAEKEMSTYIEKVEVRLHPTFNPWKIQFRGDQKVEVKRLGWGTFRIDIKITWKPQFGGFVEVHHDLEFQPKVSKIVTCKLGN